MEVVIDLMEAYSDYVKLPLLLVNIKGEIEYKADKNNNFSLLQLTANNLLELKKIALQLANTTIISIPSSSPLKRQLAFLFYMITPAFPVQDKNKFLVAGPFRIAADHSLGDDGLFPAAHSPMKLNEEEIQNCMIKMNNLRHLLIDKAQVESKSSILEQMIEVLQVIGEFDDGHMDYNQFIYKSMDELVKLEPFDFLGLAMKDENDMFVIKYACGEHMHRLKGKRFFMGEGLIGKAVILGEDFYWSRGINTQRMEFLNRFGIYPDHLFGCTVKLKDTVNGILFGGNFREDMISDKLLKLIRCIVDLVAHLKNTNTKLMSSYYIQSLFINWLDMLDITMHAKDKKQVSYKILDLCQTLNNGNFSCFSTVEDDFAFRGESKARSLEIHHQLRKRLFDNSDLKLWIDQNYIHFILDAKQEKYSLFTVEFPDNSDLKQASIMIGMIQKLFIEEDKINNVHPAVHDLQSKFDLLHSSMKEMNKGHYYLSRVALRVVDELDQILMFTAHQKQILMNLCKVMPYRYNFLKEHIKGTSEWSYLQEIQRISHEGRSNIDLSLEGQVLLFIEKVIINNEDIDSLAFMNPELQKLCIRAYRASIQNHELNHNRLALADSSSTGAKQPNDEVKGVISTFPLTLREQEVLYLVFEGLNNHEIASYLNISFHTVKNHVTNIFKKLNVSDRMQAISKIYRIKYDEL